MLDTNIIIFGIAFAGNERKLLDSIYCTITTLVLNEYVALEAKTVLKRKFPGKESLLDDFIDMFQVEIAAMPLINYHNKRN